MPSALASAIPGVALTGHLKATASGGQSRLAKPNVASSGLTDLTQDPEGLSDLK